MTDITIRSDTQAIRRLALFFSLLFLAVCPLAALYTGETDQILSGWLRILSSPCPLVTDYYQLGNLPAAFLNAGVCGLFFTALFYLLRVQCEVSFLAGYFLVVAHAFYGLNLLNMLPPVAGILLYCHFMHVSFRDNLDMAMFSTAFGPFFSELWFRYPLESELVTFGHFSFNPLGIGFSIGLMVLLGFAIPAMLPGAQLLHRGFNLYNGGLAFGLLGLLVYAFLYKTMGMTPVVRVILNNRLYDAHGRSYLLFGDCFFLVVFGVLLGVGWWMNGRSLRGYLRLTEDSGHHSNFLQSYGVPLTLINIGVYGLMMLAYFNAVILLTEGAGFTGATCGVLLASLTFSASGQQPRTVWPILLGYVLLSVFVSGLCLLLGQEIPWTLSTQGYMNGVAFATGLCPFAGCYSKKVGVLAGAMCAVICTTTTAMHGGFMLYNGGLSAGITALILTPMLDHYHYKFVQ